MKVYFIGIGGIGVSALAQYYLSKGHEVLGSDLAASEITDLLKKKGAKIFVGKQKAKNISKDLDLVVFSPAVPKNNPEFLKARSYKIEAISYPEALGQLTKEFYTIAVSGSHGKSTTTAMIGLALEKAELDPTVIVGTQVKEWGSNFRAGKSKLLVIEACEYDASFLYYMPKIIVVTNVDKEHLDYFKTFENVKKAFADFKAKLPPDGFLAEDMSLDNKDAKKIKSILKVPGEHNVLNALAALEVCRFLQIPDEVIFSSLSEFRGTWRRFDEKNSKFKNLKIISDYGHHPTEIMATLKAAREKYPPSPKASARRVWCVFQPHQHQRTHYLFDDFIKTFQEAVENKITDKIIITDIYDVAGRETKTKSGGVSSEKLVKKIAKENVDYCATDKLEMHIKENLNSGDVLIIMGAGDIYKLADKF